MLLRYDSAAAQARHFIAEGISNDRESYNGNSWYNDETTQDSLRLAQTGDTRLVAKAETLLSSLDSVIETPRKVFERSPVGAYCVVPEVLAGRPTPMRRPVLVADDRAPISIFAVTTCSAGISAETMTKRGVVILALVMALTRVRPTELFNINYTHGRQDGETVLVTKINTAPLDLATACYVLTSAGFTRRIGYGLAEKLNHFDGSWPRGYDYGKKGLNSYNEKLKAKLGVDPAKSLVIGAAELGDELLQAPVAWIEKQIKHFTNAEGEER